MQKTLRPKILVVGHNHQETLASETYKEYLPELAKKYKISFLDEMSKATLELAIFANTLFASKNGQDLKNRLEMAIKEGVINQNNPDIPPLTEDFNEIYNYFIQNQKDKTGFELDNPEFYPGIRKAIKDNTVESFLKEKKFFNGKIKQITYERLLEFFEEDYTVSYNEMIKIFQENPNIHYEFIDIQMTNAVSSYSTDEREKGMCQKILQHIKNNPEQELIIISVGFSHAKPIAELLTQQGFPAPALNGSESVLREVENCTIKDIIADMTSRPIEAQQKEKNNFELALASTLIDLGKEKEIVLGDKIFKRESFTSTDQKEAIIQATQLKKIAGINIKYDSKEKTFEITYSGEEVRERLYEIFPVKQQSFVNLIEKQELQAWQSLEK